MKKKLILLFPLLYLSILSYGQDGPLDSLQLIFSNLNPAQVPTGILLNRTYPFGDYQRFRGNYNTADSVAPDTADRNTYFQHYLDIRNASYTTEGMPPLQDVRHHANEYIDQGKVPIGIIHYKYNYINVNAYDSGWLDYDTITDRVLNPTYNSGQYLEGRTFVACVLQALIEQPVVTFIIPSNLFFTNLPVSGTTVKVNFGDGRGFVEVQFNQDITVDYSTRAAGDILITVDVTPPGGGNNGGGGTYRGSSNPEYNPLVSQIIPDNEIETIGLFGDHTCNGVSFTEGVGDAKVYIRYKYANAGIRKPLIFVEGYDPDSDPNDNRYGNIGYSTWFRGVTTNEEGEEILQQLKDAPYFLNDLKQKGYDVIIVNFRNGTDYIERNGNALIKIISWVNHVKTTNEEIVVIGGSMGGLMARYAIRKLEKAGCCHNVKLYVTFDSPHQGANIPLGIQHTLKYFSSFSADMQNKYDNQLNIPAAWQMLVSHVGHTKTSRTPQQMHSDWQALLDDMGHPESPVRMAVVNGSVNGTSQPFNGGDRIFYAHWGWLCVLPFPAYYTYFDTRIFAIPNSPNQSSGSLVFACQRPKNKAWATADVLSAYLLRIHLPGSTTSKSFFLNTPSLPYDNCPGSTYPGIDAMYNGFKKKFSALLFNTLEKPFGGYHTFVPTQSALDYSTTDLLQSLQNVANPANKSTPFEDIYSQNSNQRHVEIVRGSGISFNTGWMLDRLDKVEYNLENLPSTKGTRYNFANNADEKFRRLIRSVNIQQFGQLCINEDVNSNFNNPLKPVANSEMEVGTSMCGSVINVYADGEIVLGHDAQNVHNVGILRIHKNSVLHIYSGGKLVLHNFSRVIVEEGAQFIYDPGAIIELDGDDAEIYFSKSTLILSPGADFTFIGSGFVSFENNVYPPSATINAGNGSKISLSGSDPDDVVMKIFGSEGLILSNLAEFNINNGKILMGSGSRITTDLDINLTSATISALFSNKRHRGVQVFGQPNVLFDNVYIENGDFGIRAEDFSGGNRMTVNNTEIHSCDIGIYAKGVPIVSSYTKIQGCINAIQIDASKNLSKNTDFSYCNFLNNANGVDIEATNSNTSVFNFSGCIFDDDGNYGLDVTDAVVNLTCCAFVNSDVGMRASGSNAGDCQVHMENSSYCAFTNNTVAISCSGYAEPYIDDGKIYFAYNTAQGQQALDGLFNCGYSFNINATYNYWNNGSPVAGVDYTTYRTCFNQMNLVAVKTTNALIYNGGSFYQSPCFYAYLKKGTSNAVPLNNSSMSPSWGQFYPNPYRAGSKFVVQVNNAGTLLKELKIYNTLGQLVATPSLAKSGTYNWEADLPQLNRGWYFAEVLFDDNTSQRSKLLVE